MKNRQRGEFTNTEYFNSVGSWKWAEITLQCLNTTNQTS